MRNSEEKKSGLRSVKKAAGILVKVVCTILAFVMVGSLLNYMTTPAASYTRIQFHDLYTKYGEDGENMDMVFLGTSHAYRAFDPRVFDEVLGINSYNMGTSQQTISSSYYVLKEVLKTNHPEKVVFELTYTCFRDKDHLPLKNVIISQYMKPSFNKLAYILHEFDLEDIFYAILPAYTFREKMNADNLASILGRKSTAEYKNYDIETTRTRNEWMESKGYVYTNKSLSANHAGRMNPEPFEEDVLNQEFLEYFDKMVELCREEGVEFVCVTAPIPKGALLELENYDEVCDFLNELTAKHGVPYYNFNLIKEEWLPLDNSNFFDSTHINGETSKDFSRLVAQIFAEEDAGTLDRNKYFYRDWEEAKPHIDYVANAFMTVEEDDYQYTVTGHATSGVEGAQYEYSYWLYEIGAEEESQMIRDWSTDATFTFPKDFQEGSWRLMVAARFAGSDMTMQDAQRDVVIFPYVPEEE